ncbi:MAG TPA: hypothetical protein VGL72_18825 [Bryobacteraceae bacterium]
MMAALKDQDDFEQAFDFDALESELRAMHAEEEAEAREQARTNLKNGFIDLYGALLNVAEKDKSLRQMAYDLERQFPGLLGVGDARLPVDHWIPILNPPANIQGTQFAAGHTELSRFAEYLAACDPEFLPEGHVARKKAELAKQLRVPISCAPQPREV